MFGGRLFEYIIRVSIESEPPQTENVTLFCLSQMFTAIMVIVDESYTQFSQTNQHHKNVTRNRHIVIQSPYLTLNR